MLGVATSFLASVSSGPRYFSSLSFVRRPMTETGSETADLSVPSVRICDPITRRIFAAALLSAPPECTHGRTLAGAADGCAFSFIFSKLTVNKRIAKSERLTLRFFVNTTVRKIIPGGWMARPDDCGAFLEVFDCLCRI
jgi:hypothetical protein